MQLSRRQLLKLALLSPLAFLARAKTGEGAIKTTLPQSSAAQSVQSHRSYQTGVRGQHPGAYESAHQVTWQGQHKCGPSTPLSEHYDLVVVGAGLSGLTSAFAYQQRKPKANILILDNHDDFGGHARRNAFCYQDQCYLHYGGAQSLEKPAKFKPEVKALLHRLGVSLEQLEARYDRSFLKKNKLFACTWFNRERFGESCLIQGTPVNFSYVMPELPKPPTTMQRWTELLPLTEGARSQLEKLYKADLAKAVKPDKWSQVSYWQYIQAELGVTHPDALDLLRECSVDDDALGADVLSFSEAASLGMPGFLTSKQENEGDYVYHFPDGNATLARLLVQKIAPTAWPKGANLLKEGLWQEPDYTQLDKAHNQARLRLSSTVCQIEIGQEKSPSSQPHRIHYLNKQQPYQVTADKVIMAGFSAMLPYVIPQLPEAKKQAFSQSFRLPLVYTTVLLRNWQAIKALGLALAYCPTAFYQMLLINYPIWFDSTHRKHSIGSDPSKPITLTLIHVPIAKQPGLAPKEQARQGRYQLLAMTEEGFNQAASAQLDEMLEPAGFNSKQDIIQMTHNRWAHGYAYPGTDLFDPQLIDKEEGTQVFARAPFRGIAFAGTDTAAVPLSNQAIAQGIRAVTDLIDDCSKGTVS